MAGRTLWHVNSTSEGGGVAELLRWVLGYLVDGGIRTRWLVVEGTHEFFLVTKRIHNRLHGSPGDGGRLGEAERRVYRDTLDTNLVALLDLASPGDIVVLHDPQTAGLVRPLCNAGTRRGVGVPRGHRPAQRPRPVGVGFPPAHCRRRARCLLAASLRLGRTRPAEDAGDPPLHRSGVTEEHRSDGLRLLRGPTRSRTPRPRGSRRVAEDLPDSRRSMFSGALRPSRLPTHRPTPPLWSRSPRDRLKDHVGVLQGFARHVPLQLNAHLILAGPAADSG